MEYLNNLLDSFTSEGYLINALVAVLILIVGLFIAKLLKKLTQKLLVKTGIDNKLKSDKVKLSSFIAKLVHLLLMILVFMLVLGKLGLTDVLEPLKELLSGFTGFIPKLVGAGLVAYIGYMLANVVSELVGLSGDSIKKFTPKLKLPENIDLVGILKKIVFIFIFIPLLIVALGILDMTAISDPATNMLEQFMSAIPKIFIAVVILIIAVVGGKFISGMVKDLLKSMNVNSVFNKMGLDSILGDTSIVKLIGNLVFFFIVLFGITTAVEKLEFAQLSEVMETVINYSGKILFGLVILAIGNWIAGLAYKQMAKNDNAFLASVVRMAVIAIFLAIGLNTMGIADSIINLAFGLTLGAIALTIVLSFGLGGREAAGKQMEQILNKFNNKK
ncbi:mechanosensitive ion channel [Nonlabens ulvanivorans]|uniref:mechanosensitive ion channel n=1 Tax=Nonlabens ulvanivorans TaxID=906888 RepID=UPI00294322ED|nr:mechanosensitive ion channel [Nonlabens ulvanivorans]WOI21994.1 mechanosensitive ion channel [Nonlabens ulvanivorans]